MPVETKSAATLPLLLISRFNGLSIEVVIVDSIILAEPAQCLMQAEGAESAEA